MPEPILRAYSVMQPRIEAEERSAEISSQLYSNGRTMPDTERGGYRRALEDAIEGESRAKRAQRITPGMARRFGIQLRDGKQVNKTA